MIECNSKSHIEVPETLEELQSIVNSAIDSRITVKVVGSRHSYTDVICTAGIPIHMKAEFKVVPSYKLIIHNWEAEEDLLIESPDELINMAKKEDLFQFWWFPTSSNLVISQGKQIDYNLLSYAKLNLAPNVSPLAASVGSYIVEFLQYINSTYLMDKIQKNTVESLYRATFGKESMYVYDKGEYANTAYGFSHDLMANKCQSCPWGNGVDKIPMVGIDYSVSLPLRMFSEVIADMKKLLDKYPTSFPWFGLYFRFSTNNRGVMSVASGEEHFHIEWLSVLRKNQYDDAPYGISIYQSLYQLLINKYGGRPHWGKTGLAYLNHDTISSRYYLEVFQKAMQKYDPNGIFLNKFGKRLLGSGDEAYDIPSKVTRCAIGNYCICKKDSDCPKNYKCGSLAGYKVCY
ncbi:hypothetical protein CONCODRAFT_17439 [Conidiobolus coronatus NRRL 28638]|uniref:D-arabinono-1,4-lactone oxidase C-terminal domain-containing protein n=1 Tax=Conidiobolus coronatus (strain ATCC 28846 / CBS 209.66 / NRRL 28638) TaxID=796925 RepID=A0A137P6M8_CONC2|nr:hypothetical protein CONCODRAFT_17439 [Conidiobolus coronatus NRRL 28638]|eukprot:KXN70656.1 hypothetical protein CONCODRAFT_17439 [Conidiobolus coronatus NRRL 28638]